jgi:LysR family transcriptional regulator, hypochlorite-specific transcription factor HypT
MALRSCRVLPRSAVKKELFEKKLVSAGEKFEITMDIRIYRERPASSGSAKNPAQALCTYLQTQNPPGAQAVRSVPGNG